MPEKDSLLAKNLEFVLQKSLEHCRITSSGNIKNVLLFFYNAKKSKKPIKIGGNFEIIPIDYHKDVEGNFIALLEDK